MEDERKLHENRWKVKRCRELREIVVQIFQISISVHGNHEPSLLSMARMKVQFSLVLSISKKEPLIHHHFEKSKYLRRCKVAKVPD